MKIKEIKIRDDDGSYSDAIPVGVDAINADYNDTNVKDELDKLNNENNDRKNEINILNANDNSLQQQINTNKTNIELQASRIDNLATLQDGSTTGDAELIDGRIGYDGTQYTSLGDSIRTQIQDIYDTRDWMRINITNKDIENGTWENGVKVTYSIRLRSKEKYKVSAGDVVEWNMHGQGIGINLYAQEDGDNVIIDSGWRDGNSKWIIPQDGWIIFKFRKIDDSDIRAEEYVGRVSISKSFQSSDPIIAYGPAMSCYIGNNKEITCDKNSIYLYDTLMICTKDHGFAFGVSFDDMIASLGETVAIKENDILKIKMGSYQMLYFDLVDNKIKRKRAADAIKEASSIMPLAYSGGSGQLSGLLIDIATKLIVDKLPNKEWRYGTKVEVYIGNDKKIILTEHAGSNGGKIYLDFYDGIVLTLNNVGLGFSLDDILNALPDCTEMIDNKYLRLTLDSYDSLVYNTINKTLARRGTFSTIQTDDIVLMSNGWGNAASGKLLEVINKNQIKQINSKITELEHMKSTLPDYYLDEIKDTRYKLASLPSDNFNYLIITDIHYSRSEANQYKNMIQSLETLANGCNIDAVFFLGDLIEGGQSAPKDDSMALMSEAMEGFRQIRKPVLNAFGNHDHNQYNWWKDPTLRTIDHWISLDEWKNIVTMPYGQSEDYMYMDFDKKNTRVIIVNSADYTPTIHEDGTVTYADGYTEIKVSNEQLVAIAKMLLDSPDNYNIIVATHGFYAKLLNLIKAYNDHSTWTNPDISSDIYDFSTKTNKVVLHSCGHEHNDALEYSQDYHCNLLVTTTGSLHDIQWSNGSGNNNNFIQNWDNPGHFEYPRQLNTINECSYDIISIGHNKINKIKFGAGRDNELIY